METLQTQVRRKGRGQFVPQVLRILLIIRCKQWFVHTSLQVLQDVEAQAQQLESALAEATARAEALQVESTQHLEVCA